MPTKDSPFCANVRPSKSSIQRKTLSSAPGALRSLGDWRACGKDALILEETTPKLRSIYHREGDWQSIIAGVMELPLHLPEKIRGSWNRNLEIARAAGVVLPPQQFAELFVDET